MRHGHATRYKGTSRTYDAWSGMLQRCTNERHPRYKDYGGRGIKVCGAWRIFLNFLQDMKECPEGYVLDRKDNDGNYCPSNCRWVTYQQSAENKGDYKSNTSGYKGVSFHAGKGRWAAYGNRGGRREYLGAFATLEAAVAVRMAWEAQWLS